MNSWFQAFRTRVLFAFSTAAVVLAGAVLATPARAQGPSPEAAPTLFPGGAYVSYNSVFESRELVPGSVANPTAPTARPTLVHEAIFRFGWGFRRDFQLATEIPIATRHFVTPGATVGGTGLGDLTLLLKYRFFRRDSQRGTTQVSFTVGPKLPTGRTNLRDASGRLLPVPLQPGSGSTDVMFRCDATYTGLFHIKRLVADESLSYWFRTEGSQQFRLGRTFESRFWLSYRPYQTRLVDKEWFIGPTLTWRHAERDRLAGAALPVSGGDVLAPGLTTYFSPMPGLHLWFGAEFPAVQSRNGAPTRVAQWFSFGITRQFRIPGPR